MLHFSKRKKFLCLIFPYSHKRDCKTFSIVAKKMKVYRRKNIVHFSPQTILIPFSLKNRDEESRDVAKKNSALNSWEKAINLTLFVDCIWENNFQVILKGKKENILRYNSIGPSTKSNLGQDMNSIWLKNAMMVGQKSEEAKRDRAKHPQKRPIWFENFIYTLLSNA